MAQTKAHLTQPVQLLPKLVTTAESARQPAEQSQVTSASTSAVTSQELSVAQMMMTLAQASSKNVLAHGTANNPDSKNTHTSNNIK